MIKTKHAIDPKHKRGQYLQNNFNSTMNRISWIHCIRIFQVVILLILGIGISASFARAATSHPRIQASAASDSYLSWQNRLAEEAPLERDAFHFLVRLTGRNAHNIYCLCPFESFGGDLGSVSPLLEQQLKQEGFLIAYNEPDKDTIKFLFHFIAKLDANHTIISLSAYSSQGQWNPGNYIATRIGSHWYFRHVPGTKKDKREISRIAIKFSGGSKTAQFEGCDFCSSTTALARIVRPRPLPAHMNPDDYDRNGIIYFKKIHNRWCIVSYYWTTPA